MDFIRPNFVITTKMVFANIIKLALNDFVDGCYFPEWTTDIPSVLAYGLKIYAPIFKLFIRKSYPLLP